MVRRPRYQWREGWKEERRVEQSAQAGDQARHDRGDKTAATKKKGWVPLCARNEVLKTW